MKWRASQAKRQRAGQTDTMPRVHLYLPHHLHNRRDELPIGVTLSSLLADGFERHLAEQDRQKAAKRPKRSA